MNKAKIELYFLHKPALIPVFSNQKMAIPFFQQLSPKSIMPSYIIVPSALFLLLYLFLTTL